MPFIISPRLNKCFKLFKNSNQTIKRAHGDEIKINNNRVLLEVSGNIDLNKINELITLDIDYISTGDLTKNVDAADYSLLIE